MSPPHFLSKQEPKIRGDLFLVPWGHALFPELYFLFYVLWFESSYTYVICVDHIHFLYFLLPPSGSAWVTHSHVSHLHLTQSVSAAHKLVFRVIPWQPTNTPLKGKRLFPNSHQPPLALHWGGTLVEVPFHAGHFNSWFWGSLVQVTKPVVCLCVQQPHHVQRTNTLRHSSDGQIYSTPSSVGFPLPHEGGGLEVLSTFEPSLDSL